MATLIPSRNPWVLSVVFVAVAGCGGSAAPGNAEGFLARILADLCKLDVSCGAMPDMATCTASFQTDTPEALTLEADLASGKVRYDQGKAAACLDFADRFYGSACTFSATADKGGSEACGSVFVGTIANGGACFGSFQCASAECAQTDTACAPSRQCCAGTCVEKPAPIPIGADCSGALPDQLCADSGVCIRTDVAGPPRCVLPSKMRGMSCTMEFDCAPPLFCDVDPVAGTGTCQPAVATGATCNSHVTFGSCDDLRDYCDTKTSVCTRAGVPGDTCDPSQRSCLGYAQCIGSTCVALSSKRGACDPSGSGCLNNLQCSAQTHTCEFPATAGSCS